jgi:hypothetical protein
MKDAKRQLGWQQRFRSREVFSCGHICSPYHTDAHRGIVVVAILVSHLPTPRRRRCHRRHANFNNKTSIRPTSHTSSTRDAQLGHAAIDDWYPLLPFNEQPRVSQFDSEALVVDGLEQTRSVYPVDGNPQPMIFSVRALRPAGFCNTLGLACKRETRIKRQRIRWRLLKSRSSCEHDALAGLKLLRKREQRSSARAAANHHVSPPD